MMWGGAHPAYRREFKLKPERINDGRLVVLRAGAAFDQAQSDTGPIPLLLGLLATVSALRKNKRGQAVHECPDHVLLPEQAEALNAPCARQVCHNCCRIRPGELDRTSATSP